MGEVVKLDATTLVAYAPEDILRSAAKSHGSQLDYVLVLGWTHDKELFVASSNGDLLEANYIANRLIAWIHLEGGAHPEEGEE